jgi:hypothetical protein
MVRFDLNRALDGALENLLQQLPELLALVLGALGLAAGLRWTVSRIDARRRSSRRRLGALDGQDAQRGRADPPTIS